MEPRTASPFVQKLTPYFRYAEIAALLLSGIGLALIYSGSVTGNDVIQISLSTLAVVYYLYAFTLPPAPSQNTSTPPDPDGVPATKGFLDMLVTVVRKVAYIGSAVAVVGLLFVILQLNGSGQMILIGVSALLIACLLSGILILRNNSNLLLLQGPLLRALPLLVITGYWLSLHWPITA